MQSEHKANVQGGGRSRGARLQAAALLSTGSPSLLAPPDSLPLRSSASPLNGPQQPDKGASPPGAGRLSATYEHAQPPGAPSPTGRSPRRAAGPAASPRSAPPVLDLMHQARSPPHSPVDLPAALPEFPLRAGGPASAAMDAASRGDVDSWQAASARVSPPRLPEGASCSRPAVKSGATMCPAAAACSKPCLPSCSRSSRLQTCPLKVPTSSRNSCCNPVAHSRADNRAQGKLSNVAHMQAQTRSCKATTALPPTTGTRACAAARHPAKATTTR